MTKFLSDRVKKTPPSKVSAERYQFLKLSEAEPDLGVPAANNYVLTSDTDGNRLWTDSVILQGFTGSKGDIGFTGSKGDTYHHIGFSKF